MESDTMQTNVCSNCFKSLHKQNDINLNIEKCEQWLDSCNLSEDFSSANSENVSCCFSTESEFTTDSSDKDNVVATNTVMMGDKVILGENTDLIWQNVTNKEPNHYKNIQICKSQNVHIGNVTHIHGPVYINEFSSTLNQTIVINHEQQPVFPVVSRRTWLAQPPLDPDDVKYTTEPAKLVIIGHSASEDSDTQTGNNLLVRLIQQFHIESLKWNDIAYNFLVGADGSIYEGRGWNVIGSHTLGYNTHSIGICFIGCFMRKRPSTAAIKAAQDFIKYGVEIGAIAEDYSLLAHRQCRSSESPGAELFKEIKTWERWDPSISPETPSPLAIL